MHRKHDIDLQMQGFVKRVDAFMPNVALPDCSILNTRGLA